MEHLDYLKDIATREIVNPSYESYVDTYELSAEDTHIVSELIKHAKITIEWDQSTLATLNKAGK